MSAHSYDPGTYVKGDETRRVETRRDAVAAVFDGFVLKADSEPEADEPDEPEADGSQTVSETAAVPDEPSGSPVDPADTSRSYDYGYKF